DLHDRRVVVRGDHHEVEADFLGCLESSLERHLALLLAFFVDQQDARCADILVDLRAFLLGRLGLLRTLRDCRSPLWLTSGLMPELVEMFKNRSFRSLPGSIQRTGRARTRARKLHFPR